MGFSYYLPLTFVPIDCPPAAAVHPLARLTNNRAPTSRRQSRTSQTRFRNWETRLGTLFGPPKSATAICRHRFLTREKHRVAQSLAEGPLLPLLCTLYPAKHNLRAPTIATLPKFATRYTRGREPYMSWCSPQDGTYWVAVYTRTSAENCLGSLQAQTRQA